MKVEIRLKVFCGEMNFSKRCTIVSEMLVVPRIGEGIRCGNSRGVVAQVDYDIRTSNSVDGNIVVTMKPCLVETGDDYIAELNGLRDADWQGTERFLMKCCDKSCSPPPIIKEDIGSDDNEIRIISAAIWMSNGDIIINTTHWDCMTEGHGVGDERYAFGYLTNKNTFVDERRAKTIISVTGQDISSMSRKCEINSKYEPHPKFSIRVQD